MRLFYFAVIIVILLVGVGLAVFGFKMLPSGIYFRGTGIGLPLLDDSQIKILAVGDIMLNRGVEYAVGSRGGGDWRFPFLRIAPKLKEADILFGNLECPLAESGQRVGSTYSFRANLGAVEGLKFAGFDVLSLANNHTLDYGRLALESTMRILNRNDLTYAGAGFTGQQAFSVKIKEVKGTKIGFLAYTDLGPAAWRAEGSSSGIAWVDETAMKNVEDYIKEIRSGVDVLIVSLHSGAEYSEEPTSFQVSFARSCIEAGADLVLGHHPHIIQRIEKYKHGWIAYSLGNFVFDQDFSPQTMEGLLLLISIENKKIKEAVPQKIKISEYFQPYWPEV